MSQWMTAIDGLRTARRYTERILENVEDADWFRQPAGGVTHVAWQVGHMTVAEFRLAMQRIHGPQASDAELVSDEFMALFGKGSQPDPDASKYPSVQEIRATFGRVHEQTIEQLRTVSDETLESPSEPEHPMFSTKLGALHWTAQHEFTHAGQISLIRRLLGNDAMW